MSDPQKHIDELTAVLAATGDSKQALQQLCEIYQGGAVFSTSFSEEDQVILHFLSEINSPPSIFTLDTGRLFPETYSTWSRSREKYQLAIQSYHPDHTSLQEFIESKGPNSFYESIENRKACCYIRKVEPLKRALKGKSLWITGIRAEHSPDRQDMTSLEWDPANQIIKYHPLLMWDHARVKDFIKENDIPYNPLHDKGFVSIGCAPCTRAIQPGEDFRAGRWWWESNKLKECGLHVHQTIEKTDLTV
jgi:phosphoadenosine phosphosulfate reductase